MFGSSRFDRIQFDGPAFVAGGPPAPVPLFKVALVAALAASAELAEVLADGVNGVYPSLIPEAANRPAVWYRFAAAKRVKHLRGYAGLTTTRVTFEAQSADPGDCEAIREILRNLLFGLVEDLGTLSVPFADLADESDEYAEPVDASDAGVHTKTIVFVFKYRESTPTLS
jgi:hypothetical protein